MGHKQFKHGPILLSETPNDNNINPTNDVRSNKVESCLNWSPSKHVRSSSKRKLKVVKIWYDPNYPHQSVLVWPELPHQSVLAYQIIYEDMRG